MRRLTEGNCGRWVSANTVRPSSSRIG
jgi:hypothetical protein